MEYKSCTKCHRVLPHTQFRKDSSKKDGIYSSCTPCYRERTGIKEMKHKVIGTLDGFDVVSGNPYPFILANPRERVHRYVARKIIGRELYRHEHVHHIDGNKENYAESNIVVLTKSAHHSKHAQKYWDSHKDGAFLTCNSCGAERYKPKNYFKRRYAGSIARAKKSYMCKDCYYKSKRWISKYRMDKQAIKE